MDRGEQASASLPEMPLIWPATVAVRGHPFEVSVSGRKVSGMALIQQQRTIDYQARSVVFVERASSAVVSEALLKARAILADEA